MCLRRRATPFALKTVILTEIGNPLRGRIIVHHLQLPFRAVGIHKADRRFTAENLLYKGSQRVPRGKHLLAGKGP